MRVLLLSDANSPHTLKWAKSLNREGIEIFIWSFNKPLEDLYSDRPNIVVRTTGTPHSRENLFAKVKYLTSLSNLKDFIKEIKPDIVHAHYATSYGLLGRLCGFHPYIISVWGADVYDFPQKGFFFKKVVQLNLKSADRILSTSEDMKKVTLQLVKREITVTPFGVDLSTFYNKRNKSEGDPFVFGTIKTMEEKYGIKYLVEGYAEFRKLYPKAKSKLLIVGGGSQYHELIALADNLGILGECEFTGLIPYAEVPEYHNRLDVAIFPSILDSESFGVAAVEASATETPVIVSNVGGLPEVIENDVTGIVIPPKNAKVMAKAMGRLFSSMELRKEMGEAGRKRVERMYNLTENVKQMIKVYKSLVK